MATNSLRATRKRNANTNVQQEMEKHCAYLMASRCGFETSNLKSPPIDGVVLKGGVSHMTVDGEQRPFFAVYLKNYHLLLEIVIPVKYPLEPPTSVRLTSDRDSVLPNHPDVDQSDGTIERFFGPKEWTPAITIRHIVLEVLGMLEECNAKSFAISLHHHPNMLTQHKVRGIYEDKIVLSKDQFSFFIRAPQNEIENIRWDFCVNIRFFKQTKSEQYHVMIQGDEERLVWQAKDKLKNMLEAADSARNRNQMALQRTIETAEAIKRGTVVISSATRGPEIKCSSNNNGGGGGVATVPLAAGSDVGTSANAEGAVGGLNLKSAPVHSTVPKTQGPDSTSTPTVEKVNEQCRFCFTFIPAGKMENHLEECWCAPRVFGEPLKASQESVTPSAALDFGNDPNLLALKSHYSVVTGTMVEDLEKKLTGRLDEMSQKISHVEESFTERFAHLMSMAEANVHLCNVQKRRITEMVDRSRCSICMVRPKEYALTCGHLFCDRCLADINGGNNIEKVCAVCRQPISEARRIFY